MLRRNMFISVCFLVFFCIKFSLAQTRVSPLQCTPTEILQSECYSCRCSVQGHYWCWPKTCKNDMKKNILTKRSSQNLELKCQPGIFYQTQNLTCTCSTHGLWYTDECKNTFKSLKKIEEPEAEIQELVNKHTEQGLECKPGYIYLADCNICVCSKDGHFHISLCTQRNCKLHHFEKCLPGAVIRTRCHFCSCNPSKNFDPENCVEVPCDLDFKEINVGALSQIDLRIGTGDRRRTINDRGFMECVPNTSYMMDCNKCYCDKNGSPSCTLLGCLDTEEVKKFAQNIQSSELGDEEIYPDDTSVKPKRDTRFVSKAKATDVLSDSDNYVEEKKHRSDKKTFSKEVSDRMKRETEYDEVFSDSDECELGQFYRFDCNSCICVKSGNLACTSRVCEGDYDYVNNNNNAQFILPEVERFA